MEKLSAYVVPILKLNCMTVNSYIRDTSHFLDTATMIGRVKMDYSEERIKGGIWKRILKKITSTPSYQQDIPRN